MIYLVIMQVGESQCTDPKILQAVADTLKEAIGKEFLLFVDCEVATLMLTIYRSVSHFG